MKRFYASKTLWFNILALLVAVLSAFGFTGEVSPEFAVFVPALVAIINIVLRFLTDKGIEL